MPDPIMIARPRQAAGRRLTSVEMDDQQEARYNGILAAKAASAITEDVIANIPAAAPENLGHLFIATDVGIIYRSNGTTWNILAYTAYSPTMTFFGGPPSTQPWAINDASQSVQAIATLTSDATAPADGDTVTVDANVYTFKTALTPAEGEVLIGASAATALANLESAINHTGVPGTDYSAALSHPTCIGSTLTATTLVVVAITPGTAGNAIGVTETSAHLSWDAARLYSGWDSDVVPQLNALLAALRGVFLIASPA